LERSIQDGGDKIRVCLVSFIISKAFEKPLSNLVNILCSLSDDIYIVTGNVDYVTIKTNKKKIHSYENYYKKNNNGLVQFIRYLGLQIRISLTLCKLSKRIDFFIFFMEGVGLFPMLTVRLLRKKIVWILPSSILMKNTELHQESLHGVFLQLQTICSVLSNKIVVYSPNLIKEWNLEKFRDKIRIAHEHFLDFTKFKITKKFDERTRLVGHIGRLSEEKGTLNFVRAIPKISKENETKFLIGGDGQLMGEIDAYLEKNRLRDKVKLVGWIPNDKLPEYLNELKLIVLSSYTEGLPNVILEAMACGTPVLATPVGGIPDIIKDNETGFILKNNSSEYIEKNVLEALNSSKLAEISSNARKAIERYFTYENAVETYEKILDELMD